MMVSQWHHHVTTFSYIFSASYGSKSLFKHSSSDANSTSTIPTRLKINKHCEDCNNYGLMGCFEKKLIGEDLGWTVLCTYTHLWCS